MARRDTLALAFAVSKNVNKMDDRSDGCETNLQVGITTGAVCTLSPAVAVGWAGTADNTLADRIALAQPIALRTPRIPSYSSLCFSAPPIKQMVTFKFSPFQICYAL